MIIAVYSAKGGVGKTTLAVNLAWASAALSHHRTLLWDLDAQGAASFILGEQTGPGKVQEGITAKRNLRKLVRTTAINGLSLLPADYSLRSLDRAFDEVGKRNRFAKVLREFLPDYDRVFIDCAPGLGSTSEQILRAADLVVVPVIPSTLSLRALDEVKEHVARGSSPAPRLAPVYSMVDRRRALHCRALHDQPGWPVIPMSSAYERVSDERQPIGTLLPREAPAVQRIVDLWMRLEKALPLTATSAQPHL
jgi:cellulose biosynthesis protein BcsQ